MDQQSVLKQHGEKFALLAAVLVLAVYVVMGWVLNTRPQTAKETQDLIDAASKHLNGQTTPKLDELPGKDDVKKQWEVADTLGAVRTGMSWVGNFRTKVSPEVHVGPKAAAIAIYKPSLKKPTVDIGKVNLEWESDSRTNATVDSWDIYRKTGAGAWEKIASEKGDAKGFVDQKTQPKTTYSYKVKAIPAAVPKVTEDHGTESDEVSETTPNTVSIKFVGGDTNLAQVVVAKFINGNWLSQKCNVSKMDPDRAGSGTIGKKEFRRIDGKGQEVDFATGYVLLDIVKAPKEKVQHTKKTVWIDDPNAPGGKRSEEKEFDEKITITTLKIKYKDDTGAEKELWQEEAGAEAPAPPKKPEKKDEKPKDEKPKPPGK